MPSLSRAVLQRAIALLIALLTLAPATFALIPLFGDDSATCGMSCCRRAKTCCCRKAQFHAPASTAPHWQAAPGCPAGCRQRPALPPIAPGIAASATQHILPAAPRRCPLPAAPSLAASHHSDFALFERPPPVLS
ncbi:MAG: hypothetical protein IPP47_13780 [Bryobacterales bacterium]|nr:hypothetical protein [Bryobacterales bacterium]